jgi:hypothetical protein
MAEGLVEGAAFAVDASLIAADANKQRSAARSDDVRLGWDVLARAVPTVGCLQHSSSFFPASQSRPTKIQIENAICGTSTQNRGD